MAAGQAPKAGIAETEHCQQEGPTGPSDATTTTAPSDSRQGRRHSSPVSDLLAYVIRSRPFNNTETKGVFMKPVIRYRSQMLFRKSYKPNRVIRIRPAQRATLVVRPARAGPLINIYEYAID